MSASILVSNRRSGAAGLAGRVLSPDIHLFQGKNADWSHQFVRLLELIATMQPFPVDQCQPAQAGQLLMSLVHASIFKPLG